MQAKYSTTAVSHVAMHGPVTHTVHNSCMHATLEVPFNIADVSKQEKHSSSFWMYGLWLSCLQAKVFPVPSQLIYQPLNFMCGL